MSEPPKVRDHEVTVTLLVTTTDDDLKAALQRSGIVSDTLIGEALILSVDEDGEL